jgi:hypothetical protein
VEQELAQRIADRHMVRMAARKVASSSTFRRRQASLRDLDAEVLVAFGEGFYLPMHGGRVAFGGLVKKLKELSRAFTKAPKLWEQFKRTIGVTSMAELPGAIRRLAKDGYKVLQRAVGKAFSVWPLKLYTLPENKVLGINHIISKLVDQFPAFKRYLQQNVKPKVDQLDRWLRKYLPGVSTVMMVGIWIFIWMNVVEFEWDLHSFAQVLSGQLSLADLLASLPGSALGAMMNGLGLGTFTLLPATIVARLLWLTAKRYLVWTGRGFEISWDNLVSDGLVAGPAPARIA